MNRRSFTQCAGAAGITTLTLSAAAEKEKKPNLLIIHTDEHNFRTLGCYRDLMAPDQAFVWGEGVKVDTPNIDSLARDGAIATSYYAASPVCTPSRAALVSGLYPVHTGSPSNDMPMHDDVVTFAEVLSRSGYATTYLGKWHLDGTAKPGFAPARKFGWADNRYMFNRGHWKLLEETASGPRTGMQKGKPSYSPIGDERTYTTDFLTDRAIEAIRRDRNRPFCIMVSIPDPHGPNTVRPPYDTRYENLVFENPRTMDVDEGVMPDWVSLSGSNFVKKLNQSAMARYFGMVSCIDDNVGRMLKYLKDSGLEKDTIVVFTSDHGDLMGEHKHVNKGLPYETSAKIPFLIRWPGHIPAGKVVHSAQCNVDFAPMVLAMMGVTDGWPAFHGKDTSADYLGADKVVEGDRIVYFTNAGSKWVAAADSRYKLVLSTSDDPWLFDLKKDPDEITNFYTNPEYAPVVRRMQAGLMEQMKRFGEPALTKGGLIYETGGAGEQGTAEGLPSSEGWLVDAGGFKAKGKPGAWSRAVTVPPSKFEPNSAYELEIEWVSGGLTGEAVFFANFLDPKNKKGRQLETWTGADGESGMVRKTLKTTNSKGWTLHVGVRDEGILLVKRIRIRKK